MQNQTLSIAPKLIKKDGIYYFKHSMDFTDPSNGYTIENERDYTAESINAMLTTEATIKWIKMNNALIMYGHGSRDLANKQYLPREHNPVTGEVQLPLGSITRMEVAGRSELVIEGMLVPTPHNLVESAVRLAVAGLGKFSMVWNLNKKILFGMDFVLVGAFATNRLAQTLCEGDNCTLDSILGISNPTLNHDVKRLLKQDEDYPILREIQGLKSLAVASEGKLFEAETTIASLKAQLDSVSAIFTEANDFKTPIVESSTKLKNPVIQPNGMWHRR